MDSLRMSCNCRKLLSAIRSYKCTIEYGRINEFNGAKETARHGAKKIEK